MSTTPKPQPTLTAAPPPRHLSIPQDPELGILERIMTDTSIPLERVQEAWRLRNEWVAETRRRSFHAGLAEVQNELGQVARDRANPFTASRYATLSALDEVARPIYSRHGFAVRYGSAPAQVPGAIRVVLYLSHRDGYVEEHPLEAPLDTAGSQGRSNKTPVQALVSTVTYLRRVTLMMALNIVVSQDPDDDDGNRQRSPSTMRDYAERQREQERAPSPPAERKPQTAEDWIAETIAALLPETTQPAKVSRLLLRIEPFSIEQLERLLSHDGWKRLMESQFPPDQAALQAATDERLAEMKRGRDVAREAT